MLENKMNCYLNMVPYQEKQEKNEEEFQEPLEKKIIFEFTNDIRKLFEHRKYIVLYKIYGNNLLNEYTIESYSICTYINGQLHLDNGFLPRLGLSYIPLSITRGWAIWHGI